MRLQPQEMSSSGSWCTDCMQPVTQHHDCFMQMCDLDTFHSYISNVMPPKGFNNVVAFIIKHQKYQIFFHHKSFKSTSNNVRGNLCSVVQPK